MAPRILRTPLLKKTIGQGAPAHLHSKQEAMNTLLQSGVAVAALIDRSPATDAFVAASYATPLALMFAARVGDISHYADMTGGPVLNTSKKEVAARLAELLDQLRARYTLSYVPSSAKPAGTFCKTEVTLAANGYKEHAGLRKSEAAVRTSRGFRGGE